MSATAATAPRQRNPATTPRLIRGVWWLAVAYCALLLVAYQLPPGVAFFDTISRYTQNVPLALGAAIAITLAASTTIGLQRRTRWALGLLAGAMFCFAAGMISYIWSHWLLERQLGTAIFGDLFYLPGYLLLVAALLTVPTRHQSSYRGWHLVLDSLVVMVGAGLASWYLVVRPTTDVAQDPIEIVVRLIYPALGLGFLLALNAILLRGGPAEARHAMRWIAAGVLCYVMADGIYQVIYYSGGQPVALVERLSEVGYTAAYLCWLSGGLRLFHQRRPRRRGDAVEDPVATSPLPLFVTTGVAMMLTAAAFLPWRPDTSPLILGLVALTIALVARLGFAARQNTHLLRQQARQQGDERVAALVRHASDLFVVTEPDARIRFASPSLQAMLGRNPERAIGSWLGVLVHPDDRLVLAGAIDEATDANQLRATVTLRLEHLDGSTRECEVVLTDLTHEPAVQGLVFVARDQTERRALESRLHQAQKMEAVGRLAGGIAHDFNNVLTTILAETDLLLDTSERTGESTEELHTIRHAAQQAAALTRQLLAFARQQVPSSRTVDLEELTSQTLRLFGRTATDLVVERITAPNLMAVWADPNQISQVLLNLLLNARDAMPEGGTITVSLRTELVEGSVGDWALLPPSGRHVLLEVRDTGVGMDAGQLDRVLEPFYTTKAAGHGTGLGLPMVLSTIEKHRGGLRLVSEPGVGTTVTICLPVSGELVQQQAGGSLDATLSGIGGRERILLVDDEEAVRDVTRRLLERLGYSVELASSAEQARRVMAINGWPDLLVTDVIMPGESGAQLVESLHASRHELPVLFVSGFAGDELHRRGTLPHGTILLQKPYTAQELGEQVRAVLDAARGPFGVGAGENRAAVRS